MSSASIFDLSPSEKLQLVEDLWDDLAAVPEAVPVHDWQKQELARRKANFSARRPWSRARSEPATVLPRAFRISASGSMPLPPMPQKK